MFEGIKKRMGFAQARERGLDTTQIQRFLRGDDLYSSDSDIRLADPYKQSIAVFRAVGVIGSSVAQIPYVMTDGGKPLNGGPILGLTVQPNNQMTWFEFIQTIMAQLCLDGNAFIYIDEADSRGIPRSLMPIPPRMISPIRGDTIYSLKSWKLKTAHGRDSVYFNPEQIIHLQYAPDPNDPIIGVGPLQSAMMTVESDYAASLYNKAMLKSGGLPAGLLRYDGPGRLSEEMKEEVADSWRRTYGGLRSGRRVAVVNKEWTWQQMSASARDMEFGDARIWNLKDIARAFNVPMMYLNDLDTTGLGEAGISLYRRLFYEQNVIPSCRQIETAFNTGLWSRLSKRLYGTFDTSNVEALREDYSKKVESAERLYKIGFTINSINKRLELGLEEQPWGDDWFLPVNMVPAIDVLNHSVQLPSGTSNVDQIPTTKEIMNQKAGVITHDSVVKIISSRCIGRVRKRMMKIRSILMEDTGGHADRAEFNLAVHFEPFILEAFRTAGGEFGEAEVYAKSRTDYLAKYDDGLHAIFTGIEDDASHQSARRILNKVMTQIDEICKSEIARAFNFSRVSSYRKIGLRRVRLVSGGSHGCTHGPDMSIDDIGRYPECGCVVAPIPLEKEHP